MLINEFDSVTKGETNRRSNRAQPESSRIHRGKFILLNTE